MCNDEYVISLSAPTSSVLWPPSIGIIFDCIVFVIIDVIRSSSVSVIDGNSAYVIKQMGYVCMSYICWEGDILLHNNQPGGTYSYITIYIILNKYTTISYVWSNNGTIYITLERKWYDMGFRLDGVSRDGANNEGSILRPIGFDWTK